MKPHNRPLENENVFILLLSQLQAQALLPCTLLCGTKQPLSCNTKLWWVVSFRLTSKANIKKHSPQHLMPLEFYLFNLKKKWNQSIYIVQYLNHLYYIVVVSAFTLALSCIAEQDYGLNIWITVDSAIFTLYMHRDVRTGLPATILRSTVVELWPHLGTICWQFKSKFLFGL